MRVNEMMAGAIIALAMSCTKPQLMSYDEFSKLKPEYPSALGLSAQKKKLLYIGTYHSNDTNDSLFTFIQQEFENFKPDFVLHEGGNNWPIYADIDSTILISGEPGYIIQAAKTKNIAYESIEPPEEDEYEFLLGTHDLNWVVLMYVCRQIDQQQRFAEAYNTTDKEFEQNMNYFLSNLSQKGVPLSQKQLSYHYWKEEYQRLLNKKLDWRTFNPAEYYPNFDLTKMNTINRASDAFRNKSMVDKVFEKLEEHDKVFVLVGGGHLTVQEELLTYLFRKKYD